MTNLSAGHFFCPSRSVVFPRFFQGLPCAKQRRLQAAPGVLHCFSRVCERGPRVPQDSSPQWVGARALPRPRDVRNVVGTAWSPSTSGWGSWSPQGWPDPPIPSSDPVRVITCGESAQQASPSVGLPLARVRGSGGETGGPVTSL